MVHQRLGLLAQAPLQESPMPQETTMKTGTTLAACAIIAATLLLPSSLLGIVGDGGTKIKDRHDSGCHMSTESPGAPPSGAEDSTGNEAFCSSCPPDEGASRWWIDDPYLNL